MLLDVKLKSAALERTVCTVVSLRYIVGIISWHDSAIRSPKSNPQSHKKRVRSAIAQATERPL